MMGKMQYMTAEEAAARLGISRETLYAYVSRGLIRSRPAADGSRRSQYLATDIEAHRLRREQQRNPAVVAESVLDWGVPVLESAISLIEDGRLYYRGHDVVDLALEATFEEVAGLIWTGDLDRSVFDHGLPRLPTRWDGGDILGPIERFQYLLLLAAAEDPLAYDLRRNSVISSGARMIQLMARAFCGRPDADAGSTAGVLQEGWGLHPETQALLNAALILCADHELNVSAFSARCIASAEATPYAVVQGGLAALQGIKHGGSTARVEALLGEVGRAQDAPAVLAARLRRGESLSGFRHPLYPDGDPRGRVLLRMLESFYPPSSGRDLALGVAATAKELYAVEPNIDFALVAMTLTLDLPPGSALGLFALGRTAGWMGHALEQYATGSLIRPRARYMGPRPRKVLRESQS